MDNAWFEEISMSCGINSYACSRTVSCGGSYRWQRGFLLRRQRSPRGLIDVDRVN
jgi:hypothetical protein